MYAIDAARSAADLLVHLIDLRGGRLARRSRRAHDFFIKYQDRILFGKDSFQPREYPYYWRVFETADEYFDYYRGYHAFWKLYGISLPDSVLKKVYYQNALKVLRGVPSAGFPK